MFKTILVSLSFSALVLACGTESSNGGGGGGGGGGNTSSARAACEDLSVVTCNRMYACLSAEDLQLGGFPATEAGCVDMLSTANCSSITDGNACDDEGGTFNPDKADLCIEQVSDSTCEQLLGDGEVAPACDQVCS